MAERKGIVDRFIKEPAKEVAGWTWKLSTFGAIVAFALGKTHPGLQLGMLAVAAAILEQQLKKSPQPS